MIDRNDRPATTYAPGGIIDLNDVSHPSTCCDRPDDAAGAASGYAPNGIIDFNDIWQPPARYDLDEIRYRLAATARDWLPQLFPRARLSADKKTLRCADLSGRPPRNEGSCVIHLEGRFAGWGFDYATGESAGPIDMVYHGTGTSGAGLFEEAARWARMDRPAPPPARAALPILLTHNYTDTAWFHAAAGQCAALCFTRGRIRFVGASGEIAAPTQGQAFFYFGPSIERFRETFGGFGLIR